MKMREIVALMCFVALPVLCAEAAPNAKEARAKLREVVKAQSKFDRVYARLSDAEKAKFLELIGKLNLDDSDSDGLPDEIEDSEDSDLCDADSDDDGKPDGTEIEDEQDPGDSDSNDDGHLDGEDAKSRGTISVVTSPTEFVVDGTTWLIDERTEFEKITAEDLVAGMCVEVEGRATDDGKYLAHKVEKERSC